MRALCILLSIFQITILANAMLITPEFSEEKSKGKIKFSGPSGTWVKPQSCNQGSFLTGFSAKVEAPIGSGDDAAMTMLEYTCTEGEKLTSPSYNFGEWGQEYFCPGGYVGAEARIEYTDNEDVTGLNCVRMQCSDGNWHESSCGPWGIWSGEQQCPAGKRICGVSFQYEKHLGLEGDDTALNGVKFDCCDFDPNPERLFFNGPKGEWTQYVSCGPESFISSFQTKYEEPNEDNTALSMMKYTCQNITEIVSPEFHFGEWGPEQTCLDGYVAAEVRIEEPVNTDKSRPDFEGPSNPDQSGLNCVRMKCADGEWQSSSCGDWGTWRSSKECPEGMKICGVRYQFQKHLSSHGDDTALNGLELQCCTIRSGLDAITTLEADARKIIF